MRKTFKKIIIGILLVFVVLFSGSVVYLALDQYDASDKALNAYNDKDTNKQVTVTSDYFFFDSKGDDKAIIIYPGAKVSPLAYSVLAKDLMDQGIDVFILRFPANFALIGITKSDKVLEKYEYQDVYLAGHSLGGVAASMHINKHQDEYTGLILLASYSSKELPSDLKVLTFIGTNDEVMKLDAYKKALVNLPSSYEEVVIEGGNHAQFGSYGSQKGDGAATISEDLQREIIVSNILEFIGE